MGLQEGRLEELQEGVQEGPVFPLVPLFPLLRTPRSGALIVPDVPLSSHHRSLNHHFLLVSVKHLKNEHMIKHLKIHQLIIKDKMVIYTPRLCIKPHKHV